MTEDRYGFFCDSCYETYSDNRITGGPLEDYYWCPTGAVSPTVGTTTCWRCGAKEYGGMKQLAGMYYPISVQQGEIY